MIKSNFDAIERLAFKLIVSAQASGEEPLNKPEHLCALSLSAQNGGAGGLRLEGSENIAYISNFTKLPLIGLSKSKTVSEAQRLESVYITGTFAEAEEIVRAGADIVALDATLRPRPDGLSLKETIAAIHGKLSRPVWADVAQLVEGIAAAEAGADVISTTLYGYTQETKRAEQDPPDFELLLALIRKVQLPVVLEGRVWHPDQVRRAFELGAYAVVVGSAITRPQLITRRFVQAVPERAGG